MIMTMHDKLVYDNSTLCHICNEELGKDRVCDHCHLSDKLTRLQRFFQLYFTICLAMIVTYLLKHWEIAKEIFLVYQIMKKTTFLLRNTSSLTNLLIRKERYKCKMPVKIYQQLEIYGFES